HLAKHRENVPNPQGVTPRRDTHDPIANLFHLRRDHRPVADYRKARTQAFQVWAEVTGAPLAA
ncbi:hypothetical protein ACFSBS_09295, partial [Azospirillum griseum]